MKIKTERIVLTWTCPECNESYRQALPGIVESGGAICSACDVDCELDDNVDLADEAAEKT